MKRAFAASVWREGDWFVAQCLEIDVASQGVTEEEALDNLKEALELYFEPPCATRPPRIKTIEVEVGAAQSAHILGLLQSCPLQVPAGVLSGSDV
jgi:hypothetical protein